MLLVILGVLLLLVVLGFVLGRLSFNQMLTFFIVIVIVGLIAFVILRGVGHG